MTLRGYLAMLAAALGGVAASPTAPPTQTVVATVDGTPVLQSDVFDAAIEIRGAMPGASAAQLRDRALARCERDVVLEELASDHRLVDAGGYAGRRAAFARENARRLAAKERGEPVYGPATFQWPQYVRWRRDQVELALWNWCRRTAGPVSTADLHQRYDRLIAQAVGAARIRVLEPDTIPWAPQ